MKFASEPSSNVIAIAHPRSQLSFNHTNCIPANCQEACDVGISTLPSATSMRSWNGKVFCVAGTAHEFHWKCFVESSPSRGESPPSASVHRFPSPDLDRRISCSLSVL